MSKGNILTALALTLALQGQARDWLENAGAIARLHRLDVQAQGAIGLAEVEDLEDAIRCLGFLPPVQRPSDELHTAADMLEAHYVRLKQH